MLRRRRSWPTRVIVAAKPQDCAISFWKQYPYFYRRRAPTRGQCDSGRLCERLRKAFRILPWRICYRLEVPRSRAASFHILTRFPTIKNWRYRFCYEEEERTREICFSPSAARGTIMETQPSTFQSAQNQATFPAGVTIWLGHTPLRQCKI